MDGKFEPSYTRIQLSVMISFMYTLYPVIEDPPSSIVANAFQEIVIEVSDDDSSIGANGALGTSAATK